MRVIVFGASGLTGKALVTQGLKQGHSVTAFVRNRSKMPAMEGLTIAEGDVRALDSVVEAISGHDAVFLALGSGTLARSDLLKCGSANIAAAMRKDGVGRIIALGAAGSIPNAEKDQSTSRKVLFRLLTRTLLRNVLRDQGDLETQIAGSGLDFTIVRPARLTNGPMTGTYRLASDALPPKWKPISRRDVATFMLKQLDDTTRLRGGVYISN